MNDKKIKQMISDTTDNVPANNMVFKGIKKSYLSELQNDLVILVGLRICGWKA